jgi:hypothetical protein
MECVNAFVTKSTQVNSQGERIELLVRFDLKILRDLWIIKH